MFKSARWRSEKKFKAVFKLQFQATQVPKSKKNTLMISLVPEDVGKPTVKLQKAPVQNGTCIWENPTYETVKLIRELKTGNIKEKFYYFVVSTGSSKSGFLGEVFINFADFAEAVKPYTLSLPLEDSNSPAILHVTIQRMHEAADERDEENGAGAFIFKDMRNDNTYENNHYGPTDEGQLDKTHLNDEQNGSFRVSCSSNNTLASISDTISKQDIQENYGLKNNSAEKDSINIFSPLRQSSMPHKGTVNATTTKGHAHRQSNTDWSADLASDGNLVDSTNNVEDNFPREKLQEASENSFEKLKSENFMLLRQAELTTLELQTLRKQILKEGKRGQDLSRQISSLKQERDALKAECEKLVSLQKRNHETEISGKSQIESENLRALLEETRRELHHEKNLNTTLRLQLQKTEDSNAELILAVRELDEMLGKKNVEVSDLLRKIENKNDEDVQELEGVPKWKLNYCEDKKTQELVGEPSNEKVDLLKQNIKGLHAEIEVCKKEREELQMHVTQLALDNEILKQENHNISLKLEHSEQHQQKIQSNHSSSFATIEEPECQVEMLETEHKKKAQELLESLDKINELKTQVKNLEKELKNQAQRYEDDLEAMTCAKIEQEQKANKAEEALRKTKWNCANTTERLQEELRRISVEIESKFDENEKQATKALMEANELRMQKKILEELVQKENEDFGLIKNQYEIKIQELSNQIDVKSKHIEQIELELNDKCRQLECAKKHEEHWDETFSTEVEMLRAKINKLTREKHEFSEQAEQKEKLRVEMEQITSSIGDTDILIQRRNTERAEMERKFSPVKIEAEKAQEELNMLRCSKDKDETMVGILLSNPGKLRGQYNDVEHNIYEENLEKENLDKQVVQLKSELQKKEDIIIRMEKQLEDRQKAFSDVTITQMNNRSLTLPCDSKEVTNLIEKLTLLEEQIKLKELALVNSTNSFMAEEKKLHNKVEELESIVKQLSHSKRLCEDQLPKDPIQTGYVIASASNLEERNIGENLLHSKTSTTIDVPFQSGASIAELGSKEKTCLEEELNISSSNTSHESEFTILLTEIASLKERNKSMEGDLKEMQERYSETSLRFAEVEGERQQLVMTVRNLKSAKKN